MSKSEKVKLKGRELATRLTGILIPTDRISWKPPVDERDMRKEALRSMLRTTVRWLRCEQKSQITVSFG